MEAPESHIEVAWGVAVGLFVRIRVSQARSGLSRGLLSRLSETIASLVLEFERFASTAPWLGYDTKLE